MKLRLKNTPEQVDLVAALGSRDPGVSREAQEAFAAFIGPVIQKVIAQSATAPLIYRDMEYDEDDSPSIPLDLWYNESEGYIQTWSQSQAGGLPTSQIEGVKEMKISTYRLDSAISWMKRYARKHRLDVVSKALERMAQEMLVKQERNAWAVIMKALGQASSTIGGATIANNGHVIASMVENEFNVHDLSRLLTFMRRLSQSWLKGTPVGGDSFGLTDLFVSPEIKEQIRGFAYEPMNTRGSKATGPVALPDSVREDVWRSVGMTSLYGVAIHDLIELGVSRKYNTLFASSGFAQTGIAHTASPATTVGAQTTDFATANDEILVGLDLSRDAFVRPVARQADSGGQFIVLPDDQWVTRSEKVGFYGFLEEGRLCVDARAVAGIVV
jgi:hypothetical protein